MNTMLFQVLAAAAGALGFSLLYQIRGVKLIFCVLGGALSWLCYLLTADAGLGRWAVTWLPRCSYRYTPKSWQGC